MSKSPIEQLLGAIDRREVEAVMALLEQGVRVLAADGRRAEGTEAARELVTECLRELRSSAHRITAQWHVDNVWIAEVEASYELQDYLEMNALPRVFVVRMGADGIRELRAYGAHERPLSDHRTGEEGMWVGERWIPPL